MSNDEAFGERPPTSHERSSGHSWDASYHDGPPPWDIGYPQPAIVRLAAATRFAAPLLDVGCGTGENTLYVASLGVPACGIDVAPSAVALARQKAAERRLAVEFAVGDALRLEDLGRQFATVLDGGLFHTFDPQERDRYAASLASVTQLGGTLHVLCFSDEGTDLGPHPMRQRDLRDAFRPSSGWKVTAIVPERVQTRFHENGAPAWLATVNRVAV